MFDKITDIELATMGVASALALVQLVRNEYEDDETIEGDRLGVLLWALEGIETVLITARENVSQAISEALKANGARKKMAKHDTDPAA